MATATAPLRTNPHNQIFTVGHPARRVRHASFCSRCGPRIDAVHRPRPRLDRARGGDAEHRRLAVQLPSDGFHPGLALRLCRRRVRRATGLDTAAAVGRPGFPSFRGSAGAPTGRDMAAPRNQFPRASGAHPMARWSQRTRSDESRRALALPQHPRILVVALRRLGDVLFADTTDREHSPCLADGRDRRARVRPTPPECLLGNPDSIASSPCRPRATPCEGSALALRLVRRYDLAVSTQSGDRPTFFALIAGRRACRPDRRRPAR